MLSYQHNCLGFFTFPRLWQTQSLPYLELLDWCAHTAATVSVGWWWLRSAASSGELSLANRSRLTLGGYGTLPRGRLQPELTDTRVKRCSALMHQDETTLGYHSCSRAPHGIRSWNNWKLLPLPCPDFFTSLPVSSDDFSWGGSIWHRICYRSKVDA